jgi:hypothetical protein
MAQNEVSWDFPQYSSYSVLNAAVHPLICWNPVQNNPLIAAFEVAYLDIENNLWIDLGRTSTNYIRFPSDDYNADAVYQIRVATIGVNGTRSPYSYSTVTLSSPLCFNFTAGQTVVLANGTQVQNQRYLFLVL